MNSPNMGAQRPPSPLLCSPQPPPPPEASLVSSFLSCPQALRPSPLLSYLARVSGWRSPIPHPPLPTLMSTSLKEPEGEIPKFLVAEFQAEDEQINNGLPN